MRYQYGFVADDHCFHEEWLYAWPSGRKQSWFEREGNHFKFGEHLRGENRMVEQVTRGNALFLSTAAQHRHEQLAGIYRWFLTMRCVNLDRYRQGPDDEQVFEHWLQRAYGRGVSESHDRFLPTDRGDCPCRSRGDERGFRWVRQARADCFSEPGGGR